MAEVKITITGVQQVLDTLNKFSEEIKSDIELNKELSSTLSQKASAMAPRLTGALASSVQGNATAEKAQIMAGSAAVQYAGVQEYGWPEKNINAQPYLRPAVYNNLGYIIEKYNESIEKRIKKYNLD